MDQDAFRQTYQQVNERYCAFEKAMLTHQCGCSLVEKLNIAEREASHCRDSAAQAQCIRFLDVLTKQARFALKLKSGAGALPHGKAIRIQVGGLRGLQQLLDPDTDLDPETAQQHPIDDVTHLINQAIDTYESLDKLPFSQIMQQVSAYQGRKPVSKR